MCEYYFDSNDENGTCVPRPDNLVSHIEKGNIPEVIRTLEVISGEKNVKDVFMKVLDDMVTQWGSKHLGQRKWLHHFLKNLKAMECVLNQIVHCVSHP